MKKFKINGYEFADDLSTLRVKSGDSEKIIDIKCFYYVNRFDYRYFINDHTEDLLPLVSHMEYGEYPDEAYEYLNDLDYAGLTKLIDIYDYDLYKYEEQEEISSDMLNSSDWDDGESFYNIFDDTLIRIRTEDMNIDQRYWAPSDDHYYYINSYDLSDNDLELYNYLWLRTSGETFDCEITTKRQIRAEFKKFEDPLIVKNALLNRALMIKQEFKNAMADYAIA